VCECVCACVQSSWREKEERRDEFILDEFILELTECE